MQERNPQFHNFTKEGQQNRLMHLQTLLMQTWEEHQVEQFYQKVVLDHFDRLPQNQIELLEYQIAKQIKSTHQRQSLYFKLKSELSKRQRSISILKQINAQTNIHSDDHIICNLANEISTIRQHNLNIAQTIIQIHRQYGYKFNTLSDHQRQILMSLDEQHKFLKDSIFNNFILFHEAYDPFFLYHYDMKDKKGPNVHHPDIDKIFDINISYACRLLKAKKQILEMISSGQTNQRFSYQSPFKQHRKFTLPSITPKQKQKQEIKKIEQSQEKRRTSLNFRKKMLSLKNAKEKEKLEKKKSLLQQESPIVSKSRLTQSNQPSHHLKIERDASQRKRFKFKNSDPESQSILSKPISSTPVIQTDTGEQLYKLVPIKYQILRKSGNKASFDRYESLQPYKRSMTEPVQYDQQKSPPRQIKLIPVEVPLRQKFQGQPEEINPTYLPRSIFMQKMKRANPNSTFSRKSRTIEHNTDQEYQKQKKQQNHIQQNSISNPSEKQSQGQVSPSPIKPAKQFLNLPKQPFEKINKQPINITLSRNQQQKPIETSPIKQPPQFRIKTFQKHAQNQNQQLLQSIVPAEQKKNVKMKLGKYSIAELIKQLKALKIRKMIKENMINNPKWQKSVSMSQCYACQFSVNDELMVIALCTRMLEGPYLIKLWGPMQSCDSQTSNFLFTKYIQYIQKTTNTQQIFYNGDEIEQLKLLNFTKKFERVYAKQNNNPNRIIIPQKQFQQFLSLKCSNIAFIQQQQKVDILYSEEIQPFTSTNSSISQAIATINKSKINQSVLLLSKINSQIQNVKALNSLLSDQKFDTYQVNSKLDITNISVLRFAMNTTFKSLFIAGDGYIKLTGEQTINNGKQIIYRANCLKDTVKIYFGKGFNDCNHFAFLTSKKQSKNTNEFSVKMFNKQLYGRLPIIGQPRYGYYGYWQISLMWQDELQGRVKHPMTNCVYFGPDSFYVGIQIQGELVYAFQVRQSDNLL